MPTTTTTLDGEIYLLAMYRKILLAIKDHILEHFPKLLVIAKGNALAKGDAYPFIKALEQAKNKDKKLREMLKIEGRLCPKVRQVYGFYRERLGLKDYSVHLTWPNMLFPEVQGTDREPTWIVTDLIDKLSVLKYQQERDKTTQGEEKGKETPTLKTLDEYDIFISHASEDKDSFVRPLAEALVKKGLCVWYDEFSFKLGDRLRESIEKGLNNSRYGVVVLSKNFFAKKWPQEELNGLFSLEKKILPIWHGVREEDVKGYSPILAGSWAEDASKGIDHVVGKILEVVKEKKKG